MATTAKKKSKKTKPAPGTVSTDPHIVATTKRLNAVLGDMTHGAVSEATGHHKESVRRWRLGMNAISIQFLIDAAKSKLKINPAYVLLGTGDKTL